MQKIPWLAGSAWLALAVPALAGGEDPAAWIAESRAAAQALGGALMGELTQALSRSPVEAIAVCSERAPAIAAEQAAHTGATVGRTAVRLRNPANAPAAWQRTVLEQFEREIAAGADPAALEYAQVVDAGGVVERRWMKPIMTAPLCLTCHGASLAPEVAAAIRARYPADRATGFAAGDLRGAFYVIWREARRE